MPAHQPVNNLGVLPANRPLSQDEDLASLIGLQLMRTPEERLMVSARMSEMRANARRIKEADDTISPS